MTALQTEVETHGHVDDFSALPQFNLNSGQVSNTVLVISFLHSATSMASCNLWNV